MIQKPSKASLSLETEPQVSTMGKAAYKERELLVDQANRNTRQFRLIKTVMMEVKVAGRTFGNEEIRKLGPMKLLNRSQLRRGGVLKWIGSRRRTV